MTQNTQTTRQRLIEMMEKCVDWPDGEGCSGYDFNPAADILAPEIDALKAELLQKEQQLAEARAEAERLRLPAEAWEKQETYDNLTGYEPNLPELWQKRQSAAARAREVKGGA